MASRATSLLAFTLACAVSGTGCITYAMNADDTPRARLALYGSIEVAVPALIALAPIEDSRGENVPYAALVAVWGVVLWSADAIIAMLVYCTDRSEPCSD
jgi:hypothetical protein